MAASIHELKKSGEFSVGPNGFTGSLRYMVIGGTTEQLAYAMVAALAPTTTTAPNGVPILRGDIATEICGGGVFKFEVPYSATVRSAAGTDYVGQPSGSDPGPQGSGQEGGGNPAAGTPASREIGREFSLTTGGGTAKIFYSLETRMKAGEKVGQEVKPAPDFGGLIGVPLGGGEVQGCEVFAAKPEFSVAQRFSTLTVGYILRLMATTAKTNKQPFYGCPRGEILFLGGDIHFKDGDEEPWNVTGRFGYSANVATKTFGAITLTDIWGWNYVWFQYEKRTEEIVHLGNTIKVAVEYPKHGYVERVYDEEDFRVLCMEIALP